MKYLLLLLITTAGFTAIHAQDLAPDYYNEVGLYGGIAPFTHPTGPQYKGSNQFSYIAALNYNRNFTEHWQAGLDLSMMTRWEANGSQTLYGQDGTTYGQRPITYSYSDRTWAATVRVNRMIPFYDQFHQNRFNVYFGVAGGALITVNDAKTFYGQLTTSRAEQYKYVTRFDYEAGAGYVLGVQGGCNYYFGTNWGVNFELAPRFTHVNLVDNRIGGVNTPYDLFYFPVTLGLRFRF